jgi:hypothetical protein
MDRLIDTEKLIGAFMKLSVVNMQKFKTVVSYLNHLHGRIKKLPELNHKLSLKVHTRICELTQSPSEYCLSVHTYTHLLCGGPAIGGSTSKSPLLV